MRKQCLLVIDEPVAARPEQDVERKREEADLQDKDRVNQRS
jgi:hypothetical protein